MASKVEPDNWEDDDDNWTEDDEYENPDATPLSEILSLAHPITNVIITDGMLESYKNYNILKLLDSSTCFNKLTGPDCNICGQEVLDIAVHFMHNESTFTIYFEDDLDLEDGSWNLGVLQCIYCFNFYHRNRCNITISDQSYLNIVRSKVWACPSCVPSFVSSIGSNVTNTTKGTNYEKVLLKLAKILNPLRQQSVEMINMSQIVEYIDVAFNLFKKYGIG